MRNRISWLIGAAGLGFSSLVPAASTLSGGYVASLYDYENASIGSGFKLSFAHRLEETPLRLEATYIDTIGAGFDDFSFFFPGFGTINVQDPELHYEGLDLSVGWAFDSLSAPVSGWLKAGYYTGDTVFEGRANGSPFEIEESASGLSLGIGADWFPQPGAGLRFEYQTLLEMEDFAESKALDLLSVGLVLAFGAANERLEPVRSKRYGSERAAPTPPSAPIHVGQTLSVGAAGATLHQRNGAVALPAGTPVELISTRNDQAYVWWWVRTDGREGWILQSELEGQNR